jgi:hypothetical protein
MGAAHKAAFDPAGRSSVYTQRLLRLQRQLRGGSPTASRASAPEAEGLLDSPARERWMSELPVAEQDRSGALTQASLDALERGVVEAAAVLPHTCGH